MKSIRFILSVILTFLSIGALYFAIVDQYIIYDKDIPGSYKQMLLENLSDYRGKVIIIGGSDVHHGINAEMLENLMHRPVINLGGNGDYPYKHYIHNINKHVKEGDIIIAVMGWPYFFRGKNLSKVYVDSLIDDRVSNHFYYKNLPLYEKVKFIFTQLPYQRIIRIILSRPGESSKIEYQRSDTKRLYDHVKNNIGSPRGGSFREGPEEINIGAKTYSCDQYLITNFSSTPLNRAYPSDSAMEVIDMLKQLQLKGSKVFFSWGIAVNRAGTEKCYESRDSKDLDMFADRVKKVLNKNDISILGDYNDYLQPEECILNTYAHIKRSCTNAVTKTLYENGLNMYVKHSNNFDSEEITHKILEDIRRRNFNQSYSFSNLQLIRRVLPVNHFDKHIYFGEGWSSVEQWGLWTEGNVSKMIIKNNSSASSVLYLNGVYFNGDEETEVVINNIKVGNFILKNKSISLPAQTKGSEILTIELRHKLYVSPKSLNSQSNDIRKIKFGLKELGLLHAGQIKEP